MAGIKYTGGNPFQYITEDIVNGTLIFTPPNRLGIVSAQFKCDTDDIKLGNNTLNTIGFYSGGNAVQAPTPVTLADVITVLQNLGLTA